MSFIESLNSYEYYGILALIGLCIFIWLLMIIWTAKDVFLRSKSFIFQVFSIVIVILLNILGLILYLCLRPHRTLDDNIDSLLENEFILSRGLSFCSSCNQKVESDYIFCPNCGESVKKTCVKCKKNLEIDFMYCPFCKQNQSKSSKKTKAGAKKKGK